MTSITIPRLRLALTASAITAVLAAVVACSGPSGTDEAGSASGAAIQRGAPGYGVVIGGACSTDAQCVLVRSNESCTCLAGALPSPAPSGPVTPPPAPSGSTTPPPAPPPAPSGPTTGTSSIRVPAVECFVDPCRSATAVCDEGHCSTGYL